ncbi:MAG: reverse gyrase, partial [Aigarchaeota archaeon]|nr:reverse gyrase [Aigarchaeota archaeon]
LLKASGKLGKLKEVLDLHLAYQDFKDFFKAALGFEPWALQEVWAKRILSRDNFAIVAPTGIGKTVLGLIAALYLFSKGKRCYVIVPSSILAQQLYEKAVNFAEKAGIRDLSKDIVVHHAGLSKDEKKEALKKVGKCERILLITTDRFLVDHGDLLREKVFDFVFVDDVDSFLKSPKNIDRAVGLLGLRPEAVDAALKLIELRMKLPKKSSRELLDVYRDLESKVEEEKRRRKGILVVSGATLKGRKTRRLMIFEELLDFEVGRFQEFVRNIEDMYLEVDNSKIIDEAIKIIKRHGGGCLVFTPHFLGRAYAARVAEALEKSGLKVYLYEKMETDILQRFSEGEIDVMVGLAASRSPLARGIDLPARIRYALFVGVPRREIHIDRDEYHPMKLLILVNNILPALDRRIRPEVEGVIARLMKITPLSRELIDKIKNACERGEVLEGFEKYAQETIMSTRDLLKKILTRDFIEKIELELDITLRPTEDGFSLIIPDITGYIQASGRTSRLYPYGVAKGASIILVDDKKAFKGLLTRLKAQLEEVEFEPYNPENAELVFRQIDAERKIIRELLLGKAEVKAKDVVRAALMLVESPTKARTIAYLFGRPFRRRVGNLTVYEAAIGGVIVGVTATQGHITDLVTGRGIHGIEEFDNRFIPVYGVIKRCLNCGEQWTDDGRCPSCGSDEVYHKGEIIEAIKKLALQYNEIYIATDPDAEGEKIAYDLLCLLKPYNPRIYRLEFHEVTRRALLAALQNKRGVDVNLVESQLLRRIEDRWIGFELSMKLWDRFGSKWLSAGRVQTPVLGWIVSTIERSRRKLPLLRIMLKDGPVIEIMDPANLEEILDAWEEMKLKVTVEDVIEEEREVNPLPPYATDSLLKDAFTYLKLSAAEAMRIAQELFEAGLITYHRTDATTVSQVGLAIAKEYLSQMAPGLFTPRTYHMEGAHECIRPVKSLDAEKLRYYIKIGLITIPARRLSEMHFRMYDLIFRRFIASQSKSAKILTQRFKIRAMTNEVEVIQDIEVLEEGFLKFFPIVRMRTRVREGEYDIVELEVRRVPAARLLTEGDAVMMMKEKGIGRPSTYSKIIETLLHRGYVIERAGRLIATKKGTMVYHFLIEKFGKYVSEELTRRLEADMDLVEKGEMNYQEILRKLYEEVMEIRKTPVVAEQPKL